MKLVLVLIVLFSIQSRAALVIEKEVTSDHTIPVPTALENGEVTVCTADGKCSKFSSNKFALVPRKQHSHKKTLEVIPDTTQPVTVINNINVNATPAQCVAPVERVVVKVVTKTVYRKNRASLVAGSGPAYLQGPSASGKVDLVRGATGGLMYQRSLSGRFNIGVIGTSSFNGTNNQTILGTLGLDF